MRRSSALSLLVRASRLVVLSVVLLVWLVGSASIARAQDDDEDEDESDIHSRTGFYLGVSPLAAFQNFDLDSSPTTTIYDKDIDLVSEGLIVRAGYRLHENLAVELGAEWLTGFDVSLGNAGRVKEIDRVWAITPSVRGILPLGRFQPFARLGLGYVHANIEESSGLSSGLSDVDDGAGVFALGLDIHLTARFAFTVESEYYQSFDNELNWGTVNAGLTIRFGS